MKKIWNEKKGFILAAKNPGKSLLHCANLLDVYIIVYKDSLTMGDQLQNIQARDP